MAVALNDGLITPVLQNANKKNILELSRESKELVIKAKEKRLTKEEYTTGTFVLSNLGMYGVQQFDAILPKGVGTIMAIASSQQKVVELVDGEIGTKSEMIVTVTCDHRHIYGLHAAQFLQDLNNLIENESLKLLL
ncbi:pyruvate dehydrogenase complex subunit PDH-E2 [Cardiosporidium cionae]|uniref:Pyruvate dehydrogenase complex subunit PDH-E2 n=1 Tax=Cardiosporidium cionae TaxID=476202 RepID=A0ABQ7J804_9APIC|nr:pyruvate dehydrogenase complex subunit PDH-E2 [Cardiosporidium cionae]|eukprot:KAF8820095.1 pyruvate dehydrogenase complex subunit PDH-E2 [Cardiosporidium cionae]